MTCPRLIPLLLVLVIARSAEAQTATVTPPAQDDRITRLALGIEPSLQGSTDRLPQYVEYFRSKLANDTRLFAFDVAATPAADGSIVLNGYVEFPENLAGLTAYLKALGFDNLKSNIELLPSDNLGKKPFGLVKTTHTLSYDSPEEPREVVTD